MGAFLLSLTHSNNIKISAKITPQTRFYILTSIYPLLSALTRLNRVILRYGVWLIIGFYSCYVIRV